MKDKRVSGAEVDPQQVLDLDLLMWTILTAPTTD